MKPSVVSVIIPLHERCDPLGPLYKEYLDPLRAAGLDPEFLFVAAPSHAAQANEADVLRKSGEPVRVLRLAQPTGPAMLTRVGAIEAKNDLLLVLPAYRRIEAQYLPGLVERVHQGADAAFAARVGRREPLSNRARRWLFHSLARPVTRNRFHDLGCGVAALRRDALLETPIYGDFFRFLPTLMQREGFEVVELPAQQHPGDVGVRFYGPAAYLRAAVDLLGSYFLARFTERPLRFFGLIGLLLGGIGAILLVILLVQRIGGVGIANRPALLLGTLFLALGIQSIALGLVAEIIVHLSAPTRRPYRLARLDSADSNDSPG